MRKVELYYNYSWIEIEVIKISNINGKWKIEVDEEGNSTFYLGVTRKYFFFFKQNEWINENSIIIKIIEEFENDCTSKTM